MFGPHVSRDHASGTRPSITKHITVARKEAENEGFDVKAVALFVAGPRNRDMTLGDTEADELARYLSETKLVAIAHGTYKDVPWNGDPTAAAFIRQEVDQCHRAGISGLVVHLPNKPPAVVVQFLARLFTSVKDVRIYLEMVAVSPAKSQYETPQKLKELFQLIRAKVDPMLLRTGLCIDTAHIWSCGVDISSYELAEKWLNDLEGCADIIPPEKIMFHLNDSVYACGDGRDEHKTLLQGKIWGDFKDSPKESGLAAFVDYANKHNSVAILERKPAEALLSDYRTLFSLSPASQLKSEDHKENAAPEST